MYLQNVSMVVSGNCKNEALSLRFEVIQKMNEDVRLNWKGSDAWLSSGLMDCLSRLSLTTCEKKQERSEVAMSHVMTKTSDVTCAKKVTSQAKSVETFKISLIFSSGK